MLSPGRTGAGDIFVSKPGPQGLTVLRWKGGERRSGVDLVACTMCRRHNSVSFEVKDWSGDRLINCSEGNNNIENKRSIIANTPFGDVAVWTTRQNILRCYSFPCLHRVLTKNERFTEGANDEGTRKSHHDAAGIMITNDDADASTEWAKGDSDVFYEGTHHNKSSSSNEYCCGTIHIPSPIEAKNRAAAAVVGANTNTGREASRMHQSTATTSEVDCSNYYNKSSAPGSNNPPPAILHYYSTSKCCLPLSEVPKRRRSSKEMFSGESIKLMSSSAFLRDGTSIERTKRYSSLANQATDEAVHQVAGLDIDSATDSAQQPSLSTSGPQTFYTTYRRLGVLRDYIQRMSEMVEHTMQSEELQSMELQRQRLKMWADRSIQESSLFSSLKNDVRELWAEDNEERTTSLADGRRPLAFDHQKNESNEEEEEKEEEEKKEPPLLIVHSGIRIARRRVVGLFQPPTLEPVKINNQQEEETRKCLFSTEREEEDSDNYLLGAAVNAVSVEQKLTWTERVSCNEFLEANPRVYNKNSIATYTIDREPRTARLPPSSSNKMWRCCPPPLALNDYRVCSQSACPIQ